MRVLALAILTIVTVWAAGPVRAQTYNPDYPVCLHVYDLGANYFEGAYTSLAQCAMSASGLATPWASIFNTTRLHVANLAAIMCVDFC